MSRARRSERDERVIVALDEASAADAAVDAAVRLARAIDARLTALFVENTDLLRAAALPFLTETGRYSGIARPLPRGAIARMLGAHAEQIRSAVAAAAEATGLEWRFEIVHGRRSTLLADPSEPVDFLVLAQSAADAAARLMSQSHAEPIEGTRPVAVTVRDVRGVGRALRAAHAVAAACDAPMLVLLCGPTGQMRGLRQLVHQTLGPSPRRAAYLTLSDADDAAIAAASRQHEARLLVCCDGELRRDPQRLDTLLARVRCPVVVTD